MKFSLSFLALLITITVSMPAVQASTVNNPSRRNQPDDRIVALEQRIGGRVGVLVLDTGSGQRIEHRANERFPMCSTFKLLLSGAILSRVDRQEESLDRRIPYEKSDLLEYAPIARQHLHEGRMTVGALCAAAIEWSDNTAANLLLQSVGGPTQLTAYLRSLGDQVTRLDRTEPSLNTGIPGDPRDTATPASMLNDVQILLLGEALSPKSRQYLEAWLAANRVGGKRLRAGLPPGWQVGDKTGTGENNATNDVAIVRPPNRPPILVVTFLVGSKLQRSELEAAIADIGRLVADTFSQPIATR